MQFAKKEDLSPLLTTHPHADRLLVVCDGTATKSEARFNPQNAHAFNAAARCDWMFGSADTAAQDLALATGVQGARAPHKGVSPNTNAPVDPMAQSVEDSNGTFLDATSSTCWAAVEHAMCGALARHRHRGVTLEVLPPSFLSLSVMQTTSYVEPRVLSEREAVQYLQVKGMLPETQPPISERDPEMVRHGIALPVYGHVGSTSTPTPGTENSTSNGLRGLARPPRIVVVTNVHGHPAYRRVVAYEPGDNDLTSLVAKPVLQTKHKRRIEHYTSLTI
jgi:hypothetical protein